MHRLFLRVIVMQTIYLARLLLAKCGFKKFQFNFSLDLEENETAVLALTGPSLSLEDLKALKVHYKIYGVNSLACLPDCLEYVDYIVVQDNQVYRKIFKYLSLLPKERLFLGSSVIYRNRYLRNVNYYNLDMWGRYSGDFDPPYRAGWSDDCNIKVFDGYSVGYSAIQILVWLGYKNILITGFDGNYHSDLSKRNFISINKDDITWETAADRFEFFAMKVKQICLERGVNVVNISRKSTVKALTRGNIKDYL